MKTKTTKINPVVQAVLNSVPTAIATNGGKGWTVPHPAAGQNTCTTCGSADYEDECPALQDALAACYDAETVALENK